MATIILSHLLALLASVLAMKFGGKAERYGGYVILSMVILSDAGLLIAKKQFSTVDYVQLSDDIIGFFGFSMIGIFGSKVWPLWAASLQLISVGAHFVRALEIPVRPLVYAWMKGGPTWGVLVLLIAASLMHHRQIHHRQRSDRTSAHFLPD